MRNAGLGEVQAGIKIAWWNVNNLRYADDTTLMEESEELKSLLMKVKEESEKLFMTEHDNSGHNCRNIEQGFCSSTWQKQSSC